MDSQFKLDQETGLYMIRGRDIKQKSHFKGRFNVDHFDIKGHLVGRYDFKNDIVNVGKNNIFEVYFHDGTQTASSAWCLSLISLAGYSALAAGDTMGSHSGWAEFTGYSESTRQAWGPGAASAQSITNSTPVTFSINASGTVKGIFATTQNTKSGTTGTLWATALFTGDVPVTNGDQLKVTYTVSA